MKFNEAEDIEGECNAHLYIADDYGDGSATIRCQLPEGHDGLHVEKFERRGGDVKIEWEIDERPHCSLCGASDRPLEYVVDDASDEIFDVCDRCIIGSDYEVL